MFPTLLTSGQFRHIAVESLHDAFLRWPATVAAVFLVLWMHIVIVATCKLLTRVQHDSIFSETLTAMGGPDRLVGQQHRRSRIVGGMPG